MVSRIHDIFCIPADAHFLSKKAFLLYCFLYVPDFINLVISDAIVGH